MPALDGLRGLAILGVFANHFGTFPGSQACGWLGICLFFVLSGFLITGILLGQREAIALSGSTLWQSLAKFWVRRALRIFPLYYLALALILYFDVPTARDDAWWLVTYTHNFQVSLEGWTGIYGHFWTLCVEEQFYLIWPIAALAMPLRWMKRSYSWAPCGAWVAFGPTQPACPSFFRRFPVWIASERGHCSHMRGDPDRRPRRNFSASAASSVYR